MTIHIPEWLFNGPFWLGFISAIILGVMLFFFVVSNGGPKF